MVNNKAKGTALEREFKDYFSKWGYLVTRAAGSFGVDLVALKRDFKPLLINVKWKRVYCGPDERKELLKDAHKAGGLAILAYKNFPKGKRSMRTVEVITEWDKQGYTLALEPLEKCAADRFEKWNPAQELQEMLSQSLPAYIHPRE